MLNINHGSRSRARCLVLLQICFWRRQPKVGGGIGGGCPRDPESLLNQLMLKFNKFNNDHPPSRGKSLAKNIRRGISVFIEGNSNENKITV